MCALEDQPPQPTALQSPRSCSYVVVCHLRQHKNCPGFCVGSLVEISWQWKLMYKFYCISQLRVLSVSTFCTFSLCLPSACHVLDKDFSQFSGSLLLVLPGKPRPQLLLCNSGRWLFGTSHTLWYSFLSFFLFVNPFFQPLSVLFLWCHASPSPFILLPYFIPPFVLSSSTPHFLMTIFFSSHQHTLAPLFSTHSFRYPVP